MLTSGTGALCVCIGFLSLSRAENKILGALSPFVPATEPELHIPESETHLTQMVALLWRCSEL